MRPYGIKELVRTGKIAMLRGSKFVALGNPLPKELEEI